MQSIVEKETAQTAEVNETTKMEKLKIGEKLAYGLGDFGTNFSWTYVATFLTIYLTDTIGMSAAVIGTIMLISRLLDGVTDLFMGTIIDRTKSKMGKARPWVFWTAPFVALTTFLLFNVPGSMGSTAEIVYVFILYLILSAVFMTASNIAYGSLTSFMTTNPVERVSLGSIRYIFAIGAVLFISSFTYMFVESFGGGQKGWTTISLIYAFLSMIPLMITGWYVKERNVAKLVEDDKKVKLGPTLKALLTNKYFIIVLFIYLFTYLSQTSNSVQIYYVNYIFGDSKLMGLISMASMLPMIIGLMFASSIVSKLGGLRKSLLFGQILSVVGSVVQVFFPEALTPFLIGAVIKSFGGVFLMASLNALVADVGDIIYWKTGLPVQGAVFSIGSVGMKVGTGIAAGMVGWILALGAYVPNAAVQPDSSIQAIKFLMIYFPLICTVILTLAIYFLNHENFIAKIREAIKTERVGNNRDESILKH